jgi:hypothetical protein
MLKFGLILEQRDLDYLVRQRVGLLLLPPGFPLSESDVEQKCGIPAFSLNTLIEQGEMSALSRRIAPFLRALLAALADAPIVAVASQNDLYQYHLRYQYLFLTALERFLQDKRDYCLVLPVHPYRRYVSPMRPELGLLYSNRKLLAHLAARLVALLGGQVDARPAGLLETVRDGLKLKARQTFLALFLPLKLFQKAWHARANPGPAPDGAQGKVGIIVRTDSEVIAAKYLIDTLRDKGAPYLVIHDEILSSTTTLARLADQGIDSVSIGSVHGLGGVWRAVLRKPAPLAVRPAAPAAPGASASDAILFSDPAVRAELADRLLDFAVPQLHFAEELRSLSARHALASLVTFAYVDQWGAIIQQVGAERGIATVAVQNAAQDPEEYPRLCWADHYCVESTYLKQRLIQLGYPPERLTATGLPQFSAVQHAGDFSAAQLFARRRILLLTQPIYQEHYERLILACARLCAAGGVEFALKYHPRQAGNEYAATLEAARKLGPVALFQAESLDHLIDSASVVVSVVSAALIRAVNLGTPAVSFLPVEEKHLDLYYAEQATVFCVPDIAAFETLIAGALADYAPFHAAAVRKRRHYLDVHASFEPTGDSARNIVGVIESHSGGVDARTRPQAKTA